MSAQSNDSNFRKPLPLLLGGLLVSALLAWLYFGYRPEIIALWEAVQSEDVHPAALLVSFLILPVFGFPVIPFLILLGLRFGYTGGILFMLGIMAFHLVVSYWVTRSFLWDRIEAFAKKKAIHIQRIPENRRLAFGALFMVTPGLSYSMKNYLLPLSGISFFPYFLCGWLAQGIMGIPFVILGNVAFEWSVPMFLGLFVLFLLVFASRKWIFKKI